MLKGNAQLKNLHVEFCGKFFQASKFPVYRMEMKLLRFVKTKREFVYCMGSPILAWTPR